MENRSKISRGSTGRTRCPPESRTWPCSRTAWACGRGRGHRLGVRALGEETCCSPRSLPLPSVGRAPRLWNPHALPRPCPCPAPVSPPTLGHLASLPSLPMRMRPLPLCVCLPPVPPPSHTHFLAQVTPPPAGFLLGPSTWPHARDRLLLALPLRTSPPPGILADLSRQKRTPCPRGRGALGCLSPAPGLGTPQDRGALPCLWAQPRVHCNTGVECRPRRRRLGSETGFSRLSQEQPHKRLRPRPSTRCHLPVPPAALAGVLGGPRAPGPSAGP